MYDARCSPELYQAQGTAHDFPDLTNEICYQCKGDYLKKHGFYDRYLITLNFEGEIKIRRYYCGHCKKTISLLPSFCHPRRTYGTAAIIRFLKEFYNNMVTVCVVTLTILKETGIECSRQLLLQYRRRIEQNLNKLIMELTAIHNLRAPPVTEPTDTKEKVRQLLKKIQSPLEDSLKIFKRTGSTYLTKQAV
jgi:hypothetical protein